MLQTGSKSAIWERKSLIAAHNIDIISQIYFVEMGLKFQVDRFTALVLWFVNP
jgi:hypothetical protein